MTKEETAQEPDSTRSAVASAQLAKRSHVQSGVGLVTGGISASTRSPEPHLRWKTHWGEGVFRRGFRRGCLVFPLVSHLKSYLHTVDSLLALLPVTSFQLPPGYSVLRLAAADSCSLLSASVRPSDQLHSPQHHCPLVLTSNFMPGLIRHAPLLCNLSLLLIATLNHCIIVLGCRSPICRLRIRSAGI